MILKPPAPVVFDGYKNKDCHGFPGPGKSPDHIYLFNPVKELVDGHTEHVDATFDHFYEAS